MISIFKISDFLRPVLLLIILLAMRIPLFCMEPPLLLQELHGMVLAEKMASGFLIYRDIIDDTAPFTAMVYALIDILFGRSQLMYQFIALVLIYIQAMIFNKLSNKNGLYFENTYVPALIYIVCASIFYDFFTLSGALMALTFVLLAISPVLSHIKKGVDDIGLLKTGLFIGISSLFYIYTVFFIPIIFIIFILYASMTFRKYTIMCWGFVFPWIAVLIYFFWQNGYTEFFDVFLFSFINEQYNQAIFYNDLAIITAAAIFFFVAAFFKVFKVWRFTHFQKVAQQSFIILIFFTLIFIIFQFEKDTSSVLLVIPGVAFFISHFFLLGRRKVMQEVFFIIFLTYTLNINYSTVNLGFFDKALFDFKGQMSEPSQWHNVIQNKKVAVFGSALNVYRDNQLASPFLNWELSRQKWIKPEKYAGIISLYQKLKEDLPDVIIDKEGVAPEYFDKIYLLDRVYVKTKYENVYVLNHENLSETMNQ